MKKVFQTSFDYRGNCYSACIASILEVGIDEVPVFYIENPSGWWFDFESWLFVNYKMWSLHLPITYPPVYYIASGISPRGFPHAVVYLGDKMIHDPHPQGGGVTDVRHMTVFVPFEIKL